MEFTFHNSYVILEPVPSTMTFWTGLICWRKSCTNKATLLQDLIHRYKNYRVVIRIMLTITKCAYLKRQWIFYFLHRFFLSSIIDKTFIGLNYIYIYMSNTAVSYKKQELLTLCEHLVHPRFLVRVVHLFNFLCCIFVFCLSSFCVLCVQCCQCLWNVPLIYINFVCLHSASCVFNVASVSGMSLWFTLTLFVFILHLVCSMLPVSLDCPFDLH
jgi:hypothetical protein